MRSLLIVLLLPYFLSGTEAQAGRCLCGWFVDTMWAPLSNLEPLDYLTGTTIADGTCRLTACQTHCGQQGTAAGGVNLDTVVGGKTRGQAYCEKIYSLLTDDVNSEPLFVLSRVPDCEGFFLWGSTKVYTSSTTKLCCRGGSYYRCP